MQMSSHFVSHRTGQSTLIFFYDSLVLVCSVGAEVIYYHNKGRAASVDIDRGQQMTHELLYLLR